MGDFIIVTCFILAGFLLALLLFGRVSVATSISSDNSPGTRYGSSLPMPICGDRVDHYEWGLKFGMPCPKCARIETDKRKEIEEDRLARKVAMEVVRILNIHDKESGDW